MPTGSKTITRRINGASPITTITTRSNVNNNIRRRYSSRKNQLEVDVITPRRLNSLDENYDCK